MNEDQSDETSENDTMGGPAHAAPTATSARASVEIAGNPSALDSGDLFGVLEQAIRDGIDYKSGARLSDYEGDITEAIRRARRMDWWMKNATAIASERGELFRAGENMAAELCQWCPHEMRGEVLRAWDAAAQPMRDMVAYLSSPNAGDVPRAGNGPEPKE